MVSGREWKVVWYDLEITNMALFENYPPPWTFTQKPWSRCGTVRERVVGGDKVRSGTIERLITITLVTWAAIDSSDSGSRCASDLIKVQTARWTNNREIRENLLKYRIVMFALPSQRFSRNVIKNSIIKVITSNPKFYRQLLSEIVTRN